MGHEDILTFRHFAFGNKSGRKGKKAFSLILPLKRNESSSPFSFAPTVFSTVAVLSFPCVPVEANSISLNVVFLSYISLWITMDE
jgi:hypothetical protein